MQRQVIINDEDTGYIGGMEYEIIGRMTILRNILWDLRKMVDSGDENEAVKAVFVDAERLFNSLKPLIEKLPIED